MKKRHLISMIAMALAVMMLGLSCGASAENTMTVGTLSYLNMTEEEHDTILRTVYQSMYSLLIMEGVLTMKEIPQAAVTHYYDSMEAMLMGLQAGEVNTLRLPYYTVKYLCTVNPQLEMKTIFNLDKLNDVTKRVIDMISDGFSFMMKEENTALRDEFNTQIKAMKEDGTMQKLIDEHIIKASETGEPVAVTFDQFEGDPIRVAVTGSLPPMDYVAADGSFAGFNTAVLAEIGRRLQKNIVLVQVDSIGRALALSEGTVDVVFWTRSRTENSAARKEERDARRESEKNLTEEEKAAKKAERDAERKARQEKTLSQLNDEEKALMENRERPNRETRQQINSRDMPEGTIITVPYFTDFPALAGMK